MNCEGLVLTAASGSTLTVPTNTLLLGKAIAIKKLVAKQLSQQ